SGAIAVAKVVAWSSLSMTHGPAINTKGRPPPTVMSPIVKAGTDPCSTTRPTRFPRAAAPGQAYVGRTLRRSWQTADEDAAASIGTRDETEQQDTKDATAVRRSRRIFHPENGPKGQSRVR